MDSVLRARSKYAGVTAIDAAYGPLRAGMWEGVRLSFRAGDRAGRVAWIVVEDQRWAIEGGAPTVVAPDELRDIGLVTLPGSLARSLRDLRNAWRIFVRTTIAAFRGRKDP